MLTQQGENGINKGYEFERADAMFAEDVNKIIENQMYLKSKKADLNSPILTGTPIAPTTAATTKTQQVATTEFTQSAISARRSDESPIMNGTASVGADNFNFAREGHVHPTDISREPLFTKNTAFNKSFETATANIKMNGAVSVGTSESIAKADHIHPSDDSKVNKNSAITTGTKCKITYDAKGLVTGGSDLTAADIPSIDTGKLTSGTLPISRGGTGATDAATAISNLGITLSDLGGAAVGHVHAAADIRGGTLPIERGGTGAATVAEARTKLEINNVNNTSDLNKPISTVTQIALDGKANTSGTYPSLTVGNANNAINANNAAQLGGVAPSGYVSTAGKQDIDGAKTFTGDLKCENLTASYGVFAKNIVSTQFNDSSNATNYIGQDLNAISVSVGTHIFTNCTGTINFSGISAKVYITNSPSLIVKGKTVSNWQNIWLDGIATNLDNSVIRFIDGTMIESFAQDIYINSNVQSGALWYCNVSLGNFPVSFIETPKIFVTNAAPWGIMISLVYNATASSMGTLGINSTMRESNTYKLNFMVIGRWKI